MNEEKSKDEQIIELVRELNSVLDEVFLYTDQSFKHAEELVNYYNKKYNLKLKSSMKGKDEKILHC